MRGHTPNVPLSFGADQLLGALARRVGMEPHARRWLLALHEENPRAIVEVDASVELDALADEARKGIEAGDPGGPLDRAELEHRASQRAGDVGRGVVAPADVAFAIVAAQPEAAGVALEPSEPEPEAPGPEAPVVPLSFGAEQLLGSLVGDEGASADLHELVLALLQRHRSAAEEAGADVDLNALESAVGRVLARADRGDRVGRDELVRDAARRALQQGRQVIAGTDVAAVILEAARGVAAPPPAPPEEVERSTQEEVPREEQRAAPVRPRVFRVFVSSTFSDLEAERNALRERVYPALRQFCADHGAGFQDIDLRWGVSEEASLDQQAMNICLSEIERCREVTPRPNFLVLLGNRYGWRALPPQVPETDSTRFEREVSDEDDLDLLDRWFQRDENAVPTEYRLRPAPAGGRPPGILRPKTSTIAGSGNARRRGPGRGRASLAPHPLDAVENGDDYRASATEQEITAGALEVGAAEGRALCFVREIKGAPDVEGHRQAARCGPRGG